MCARVDGRASSSTKPPSTNQFSARFERVAIANDPKPGLLRSRDVDETRLLVSVACGRVLSVLDPAAGTVERHSFQDCGFGSGNPENVLCHAFSPDGSHLALGGRTPFLVRHDDWKPETTIESALEVTGLINVVHLEFSADGRWLFAGGSGQHIWVRLFRVALDESNSDHLTNCNIGGFDGSGSGIAPSA